MSMRLPPSPEVGNRPSFQNIMFSRTLVKGTKGKVIPVQAVEALRVARD
jgi:hypothetical protein